MGRRRNPSKLARLKLKVTGPMRARPALESDDTLRVHLMVWASKGEISAGHQTMINFRLLDMLNEAHKPQSPQQAALEEIETAVSGRLGIEISESQAIKEIAALRGLDAEKSLGPAWRRQKKLLPRK
jgi:hypothetical protein